MINCVFLFLYLLFFFLLCVCFILCVGFFCQICSCSLLLYAPLLCIFIVYSFLIITLIVCVL